MIEHVVVMAASPGRRMESLTRTRPKAMLPVLGKPMIARIMEDYYRAGIRRYTVVIGEKEGQVAMWLNTKWYPDVDLRFAPLGHRRGTAATLFAIRQMIDEPFIITACDHLLPSEHIAHLSRYFDTHPRDAVALSIYYAPDEVGKSASVLLDPRGNVMFISEQPTAAHQDFRITLPTYAFTPAILDYLDLVPVAEESGQHVMSTAIQLMIDSGETVGALETPERHRLRTPTDLLTASTALLQQGEDSAILSDLPGSVTVNDPIHVDPDVVVNQTVTLGPNVYLEAGTRVGANTTIDNAVILGRQIGPGQSISNAVINEDML